MLGSSPSLTATTSSTPLGTIMSTTATSVGCCSNDVEDPVAPVLVTPHSPLIPAELVGRIRGQYIEMAELLPQALQGQLGQEKKRERRQKEQITSCLQWNECFLRYVAVVVMREPRCIGDLLAYVGLITRYARQFKGPQWQVYDSNFRLRAVANKHRPWAEVNGS